VMRRRTKSGPKNSFNAFEHKMNTKHGRQSIGGRLEKRIAGKPTLHTVPFGSDGDRSVPRIENRRRYGCDIYFEKWC
jgi:hypothetical protein